MDESRQWTCAKRKHGLTIGSTMANNSHQHHHAHHHHHHDLGQRAPVNSSYDHDSWEEQAFAEDSSGPLGGCIWPPRSYSCSFCRREFRSAQALGGHMNVHRRDRARLKQSQPSDLQREIAPYPNAHDHIISPLMMNGDDPNNSIISTPQIPKFPYLVYNPNPNSDPNNLISPIISPPPPPPPPLQHEYDSSSSSFHLQEKNHSKWSKDNTSTTWSTLASSTTTDKITYPLNNKASQRLLDLHGDHKVSSITVESGGTCRPNNNNNHHHHTSDLSVSLNLVVCRSCPTTTTAMTSGYNNQEDIDHHHHHNLFSSSKRRKTSDTDDDSDNVNRLRSKEVSPSCSIEELDLELRLGNGPSHIIR